VSSTVTRSSRIHRLITRVKHRVGVADHGDGAPRLAAINGYQLWVRPTEDVGCQIYCYRRFEFAETKVIAGLVSPDATCIDVGANVGYYTLLLAGHARKGRVYAFEPIESNCSMINDSAEINGFHNVDVICCAVSDTDTESEFVISSDSAYSSLQDTGRKTQSLATVVPVTSLDTFCEQRQFNRVDFIKVDVEGAEHRVLAGARRLIGDPKRRPKHMMWELCQPMLEQYGSSAAEIVGELQTLGYTPYAVHGDGLARWVPDVDSHYNVFFIAGETLST
jgi:FkbM family methyltransferase